MMCRNGTVKPADWFLALKLKDCLVSVRRTKIMADSVLRKRSPGLSSDLEKVEVVCSRSGDENGEKILNKKAVYEPSSSQRCRQLVCSRQWAVAILITMGLFLIVIAIIAAFARPGSILCLNLTDGKNASKADASASSSASQSKVKHYISTDGRPFPWKNIRLPRTVLPDFYEIFLHPNISQSQFTGTIKIHSSVVNSTDFIVFHIKELNVTSVAVLRGEVAVKLSDRMEYKENEQLYIKLEQPLAADSKIIIMVQFKGALVSKLAGFYKSTYKTAAGEAREIATTHFEPTDARTAFPCFDEPDMKANFSLSIIRESQHITLFNMPLMKTAAYGDGLLRDDYQTSVKMSTYLVAFVVCDFKNVSAYTKSNTLVRVFAPEDQISQAVYALNVSVKVLDYYNEFFGIPYPLPKQDMIAIPDFAAGAMENWGLITYRMTSILYDAEKSSTSSKQWITIVIAHELAHQWFGNLVTMQWWNDLWLNEGFASFVEYIGADVAEPFFGMEEQFLYETLQTALYLDCFANSHPIQVPVKDPAEINEIFDKISYDKGASLISMLQGVLGKETFKKGLHNYLTTHVYQNAETYDLWQSLQEVSDMKSGMTVREVMDTWTLQMGYPVITVKRKPGTNHLLVSQTRFLLSDSTNEESKFHSPFNYTWKVPLTYFTNSNHQETQLAWLTEKEMTLPVSLGDNAWIKFNRDTYGFYRVNYEPSLWRLIIEQLKENLTVFSVRDRTGLLDDAFALARAGLLSYNIVFELVSYLNRETEYIAMATAVSAYGFIESRMYLNKVYPKLQKYMLSLTSHVMKDLGWKLQENHLQKLLQTSLLSYAVNCEDKDSIEQAKELFKDWARIPKNLKSLVYAVGVKYGDDDNWLAMFNNFSTSNVPTEKKQFLIALTETADPRRIQIFLQDSLDSKVVRSQDSDTVIGHIANTPSGHLFAWRFVQRNWKTLFKRYGQTSFILSGILKSVVAPFNTQFDYDEVTEFFKGKDLASANMALKQSLEVVKSHIDWMARYEESIASWFIKNVNTVDS